MPLALWRLPWPLLLPSMLSTGAPTQAGSYDFSGQPGQFQVGLALWGMRLAPPSLHFPVPHWAQ